MLTRNLRYLVALSAERHFARAAAACQVTQPTLSAGIKHLEEELGVLIVQRGQRFEGFTAEGERILAWARRILDDVESLHQEVSALRNQLVGRLRLGAIPTALPFAARLTTPFAVAHPGVTISVVSLSSVDIQRGLDDFTLDAGLTYLDNEPLARVRGIPLYLERYFVMTAATLDVGVEQMSWSDAAKLPLCLLTPDMQNRRILNASFAAAGAAVATGHRNELGARDPGACPEWRVGERGAADLPAVPAGRRRGACHSAGRSGGDTPGGTRRARPGAAHAVGQGAARHRTRRACVTRWRPCRRRCALTPATAQDRSSRVVPQGSSTRAPSPDSLTA